MDNLIGKKFGRLKILKIIRKDGRIYLKCICICGNIKDIYKRHVLNGKTVSCGCYRDELASKRLLDPKHKSRNPEAIQKMKDTIKRLGYKPKIRGGNGQPMPIPQRILLAALGEGWYAEHSIPTHLRSTKKDYPTCYKIDIANPQKMIAVEVDGGSHGSKQRQQQDKRKTDFLKKLGWKVLRFKNKEVMTNLELVLSKI